MKHSTILSASLALAGLAALAAVGAAAWWTPDLQQATVEPDTAIEQPDEGSDAEVDAASGDLPQPAPVSDSTPREVAEPDEGPGTTTRPAPAPAAERAEPYEGPGTVDEPTYACLTMDGRQICDTFGESDEGPGTS